MSEVGSSEGLRRAWSWPLLAVVIGAPAAASWHGLTAAGEQALGLPGVQSWLVPLVLDAAAAYSAVLALRDTERGDAAGLDRLLVWAYVAGSAALNAWWAGKHGGVAAALFFAAAAVSAAVLWDRTLRQVRREVLRRRGAVSCPTPRFRFARWLVAPSETAAAWRHAVIEDVSNPTEAVQAVRGIPAPPTAPAIDPWITAALNAEPTQMDTGFDDDAELDGIYGPRPTKHLASVATELETFEPPPVPVVVTSKAAVVREVLAEHGTDNPRAVAGQVAMRGVSVDVAYVRDVIRRDRRRDDATASEVAS